MSDASPRVTAGGCLPSHLELKIFAFPVANDKDSLLSRALLGLFFCCAVQDVDPALQQARVRHVARELLGCWSLGKGVLKAAAMP